MFGVFPAAQLARIDPQFALRSGGATSPRTPIRSLLMTTEVAIALVVLMVAALFLRGFRETRASDPGLRRDGMLLASYDLTGRNRSAADARIFASRLIERVRITAGSTGIDRGFRAARYSWHADARFHCRGSCPDDRGARPGAQQYGHTRVFRDTGHSDSRRLRLRRSERPLCADAGDRK
jgi:hypothetical protein